MGRSKKDIEGMSASAPRREDAGDLSSMLDRDPSEENLVRLAVPIVSTQKLELTRRILLAIRDAERVDVQETHGRGLRRVK